MLSESSDGEVAIKARPQITTKTADIFLLLSFSLKNIGSSSAGSPSSINLSQGECIQCMTGAKIPKGADAVIMVEQTSGYSDNGTVKVMAEVPPGKNIRIEGEEIKKTDILIKKYTRITASELSVCAAFGYNKIKVSKKPKVAIFATGNELVEPGEELKEGKIYNSNFLTK